MIDIERVVAECRGVRPTRWKYKGYRSEADALVRIPFGHLQTLLAAIADTHRNGEDAQQAPLGGNRNRTKGHTMTNPIVTEAVARIADYLVEQGSEPWPADDATRLHYWRDKAITAARKLRDLAMPEAAGPREVRERCIAIAERVRDGFLSEEYAVGQPLASIQERFACNQVIEAIRADSLGDAG